MTRSNKVVTLKSGERGRILGKSETGEYLLKYGKGGKIVYFKEGDIVN